MEKDSPLVSVLIPVRNGATDLGRAVESACSQTYENLEIIVSDNYSEDSTQEVIREVLPSDKRLSATQPPRLLDVFSHFLWLADQAKGEYLCWVAHDDMRDPNFVEVLLDRLGDDKNACLAFGRLLIQSPSGEVSSPGASFHNEGQPRYRRIRQAARDTTFHWYGLWRTEVVRNLPRRFLDWYGELPFMMSAAAKGEFLYAPSTAFRYCDAGRSFEENVRRHVFKDEVGSLFGRVGRLVLTAARSVSEVAGFRAGCWAAWCVLERFFSSAFRALVRLLRRSSKDSASPR